MTPQTSWVCTACKTIMLNPGSENVLKTQIYDRKVKNGKSQYEGEKSSLHLGKGEQNKSTELQLNTEVFFNF